MGRDSRGLFGGYLRGGNDISGKVKGGFLTPTSVLDKSCAKVKFYRLEKVMKKPLVDISTLHH